MNDINKTKILNEQNNEIDTGSDKKEPVINLHCPGFYNGQIIYLIFNQILEEFPEAINPGVKIAYIFGIFPNSTWNGGTIQQYGGLVSVDDMKLIKNRYQSLHIPLKLTFTNPVLTDTDVYDRYCNKICEIFEDGNNEILVTSPILEEYLRKKYPGYKYNRSIIATREDSDWVKLLDNYNQIVLPRRYCTNKEFLEDFPKEYRNRVELLCTDPCPVNCPRLYDHYEVYGRKHLYEEVRQEEIQCTAFGELNTIDQALKRRKLYIDQQITLNDIYEYYSPLGYTEFKLSGRGSASNIAASVTKYLIKPEWQYDVLEYMFERNMIGSAW